MLSARERLQNRALHIRWPSRGGTVPFVTGTTCSDSHWSRVRRRVCQPSPDALLWRKKEQAGTDTQIRTKTAASPTGNRFLSHSLPMFIVETLRTSRPHYSLATQLWGERPLHPGWRPGPETGFWGVNRSSLPRSHPGQLSLMGQGRRMSNSSCAQEIHTILWGGLGIPTEG